VPIGHDLEGDLLRSEVAGRPAEDRRFPLRRPAPAPGWRTCPSTGETPWPIAGLPDTLHVENGADFRSRAFKRGCEDAGIAIESRPPGEPHFGDHIERLIGTQMGRLHPLPGTTFSNPTERCEYDSNRHSWGQVHTLLLR
jgi:transposase InsO family protein